MAKVIKVPTDAAHKFKLKPPAWFAIQFLDHKSNIRVEKLTLRLDLPGPGLKTEITKKDAALKFDDLTRGGVVNLIEISHEDQWWEIVGDVSSA